VDEWPVDVRLAAALGWTGLELLPDRLWWGRNPETVFRDPIPDWSESYAWCGEGFDLNGLEAKRSAFGVAVYGCPGYGYVVRGQGPLFCPAYCEWVIAAIAAGVTVRLPGGRVING
jgi:hypothetical protein